MTFCIYICTYVCMKYLCSYDILIRKIIFQRNFKYPSPNWKTLYANINHHKCIDLCLSPYLNMIFYWLSKRPTLTLIWLNNFSDRYVRFLIAHPGYYRVLVPNWCVSFSGTEWGKGNGKGERLHVTSKPDIKQTT